MITHELPIATFAGSSISASLLQPTSSRWLQWLLASLFIFVLFLILVAQLPRGDLRDWHPFSPNDDSTEESETKNRITLEKKQQRNLFDFGQLLGHSSWRMAAATATRQREEAWPVEVLRPVAKAMLEMRHVDRITGMRDNQTMQT